MSKGFQSMDNSTTGETISKQYLDRYANFSKAAHFNFGKEGKLRRTPPDCKFFHVTQMDTKYRRRMPYSRHRKLTRRRKRIYSLTFATCEVRTSKLVSNFKRWCFH